MNPVSMRRPLGGLIDRNSRIEFRFDGKSYQGYSGDTLASALLANDVHFVARSFKYHRPRGVLGTGSSEPNALVTIGKGDRAEPNTLATQVELRPGLEARSQNAWPSLQFDVGAINQLAAPFITAGFYYKTFMWPRSFWERLYEPLIRRAAGLGVAPNLPDPDSYEHKHMHCDVLVVGAGPAGLAAATAALASGLRVLLCDEDFLPGGRLTGERELVDGQPGSAWAAGAIAELVAGGATVLMRTTVVGCYDNGEFAAIERTGDHLTTVPQGTARQRLWRIVARRAILATGAIERPVVFPGNDRPGVMMAGAVRTYLNRFGVACGKKAVILGNSDAIYRTARELADSGVVIAATLDLRRGATVPPDATGPCFIGIASLSVGGGTRVKEVQLITEAGTRHRFDADLVAMTGGWDPTLHLAAHLGGRSEWDEKNGRFHAVGQPDWLGMAGCVNGAETTAQCLEDGWRAGSDAALACGSVAPARHVFAANDIPDNLSRLACPELGKGKAFVDFQNDVTRADLLQAISEGYDNAELMKRYTTLGMATDQGKTSNVNASGILAANRPADAQRQTTTFRPPFTPISFGALAGPYTRRASHPLRHSPLFDWTKDQGAVFIEAGAWYRPQFFPKAGEDWFAAMTREVRATRSGVGVCDVSTLGKIHIEGPDAAELLDLLYTNTFSSLPVGKARYGVMLRADGMVWDDGTTARLDQNTYFMTTTTTNVEPVYSQIEYILQYLRPDLDVCATPVTDNWAQISIAGPNARKLIERVLDDPTRASHENFPFMSATRLTAFGGVEANLFRISFSGELGFEIGVPAQFGPAAADRILAAGKDLDVVLYGLEALSAMRLEKGHLGPAEMSGLATLRDLGLGKMEAKKKDFIGKWLGQRPALLDPNRQTLVGLRAVEISDRFRGGAHLFAQNAPITWDNDLGYITSAGYSPMLDRWIGLGMLARGSERMGEIIVCHDPLRGGDVLLEVTRTAAFDSDGERLHA